MNVRQMMGAARQGKLKALYVVGSNPVAGYGVDPFDLSKTFVVVQDLFLTETALMADIVLPAASAYEKDGTCTNTAGDLQVVKKAGERAGAKADFEIVVQLAERMGFDVRRLVPFGGGTRTDMGQSRGAQSGEADRHAVWLEAQGLEPRMSPFDPMAILDEIQRLVPGYDVSRLRLAAGNDVHTRALEVGPGTAATDPDLILPAADTLFTSGTLGRYCKVLQSVAEGRPKVGTEEAAD